MENTANNFETIMPCRVDHDLPAGVAELIGERSQTFSPREEAKVEEAFEEGQIYPCQVEVSASYVKVWSDLGNPDEVVSIVLPAKTEVNKAIMALVAAISSLI